MAIVGAIRSGGGEIVKYEEIFHALMDQINLNYSISMIFDLKQNLLLLL